MSPELFLNTSGTSLTVKFRDFQKYPAETQLPAGSGISAGEGSSAPCTGDGHDPGQARRAALSSGQKVKRAQPWHGQQPCRAELGILSGRGSWWELCCSHGDRISWRWGGWTGMARFTHTLTSPGKYNSLLRHG